MRPDPSSKVWGVGLDGHERTCFFVITAAFESAGLPHLIEGESIGRPLSVIHTGFAGVDIHWNDSVPAGLRTGTAGAETRGDAAPRGDLRTGTAGAEA